MVLFITNWCAFPKGSLKNVLSFWQNKELHYQHFQKLKIPGLSVPCWVNKNHFSVWSTLTFWSTWLIRQKWGKVYSNLFDQFCCIASGPRLNGTSIQAIYCGTWCERRDTSRSIFGFPHITDLDKNLGNQLSFWDVFPLPCLKAGLSINYAGKIFCCNDYPQEKW